jgi:glucokinase
MILKEFSMLLGIDIGATKVALAVADDAGQIVARSRRPTGSTRRPADDVARITDAARALIAEAGTRAGALRAVGISVPGPLDARTGTVLRPPNLPSWDAVPLRAWVEEALEAPVRLENDANAAALAEWRFGAGRGVDDMLLLTMSTGVGAGLILGGRLHAGHFGTAGEVGHVPVEWGGEPCLCGLHGCLEAYTGGAAWTLRLRAITPADSRVCALAGGKDGITPEHLVAAAREGDAFAAGEMERWNEYLARAIVNLTMLLAPQVVVLGTIARAAGERLCLGPVRKRVAQQVWSHQAPTLRIVAAELGDELPYRAGIGVAMQGLAPA